MLRSKIISELKNKYYNLLSKDIEIMVNAILSEITIAMCNNEFSALEFRGFGRFSIKNQKARKGRNPASGAPINIDAKKKIYFKPSSVLLKRLNEN